MRNGKSNIKAGICLSVINTFSDCFNNACNTFTFNHSVKVLNGSSPQLQLPKDVREHR